MSTSCESSGGSESVVGTSPAISGSSEYLPSSVRGSESVCREVETREQALKGGETYSAGSDVSTEPMLPERLFATDRFPSNGKINSYSKMQYLIDIVELMAGTKEFEVLLKSQFGSLFKLQTSRCSMSGKLVHNLLCRQLISHNKHDAWFTFGGHPLRFSISEFEKLTGLRCGPLPYDSGVSDFENVTGTGESYWKTLFGEETCVVIADLVEMLKTKSGIPGWKRLRLVLLVIVEGVLICGTQPVCASRRVVEMLSDLPSFLTYPWGRESFRLTLRRMKVGSAIKTTAGLITKLKQSSLAMHGFPLAIQLLMFEAIPSLLTYLPRSDCVDTFLDRTSTELPLLKTYHTGNILMLELDPKVSVVSRVARCTRRYSCDVPSDKRIRYLEACLDKGMHFTKGMWLGGDDSLSPLCVCSTTKSGRCTCGKSSPLQPNEAPSPVASAGQQGHNCSSCEELKDMVLRLEASQEALTENFTVRLKVEMDKLRESIVKEVVEQLHNKSNDVLPRSMPDCGGECYCGQKPPRVEESAGGVQGCYGAENTDGDVGGRKFCSVDIMADEPGPVDHSRPQNAPDFVPFVPVDSGQEKSRASSSCVPAGNGGVQGCYGAEYTDCEVGVHKICSLATMADEPVPVDQSRPQNGTDFVPVVPVDIGQEKNRASSSSVPAGNGGLCTGAVSTDMHKSGIRTCSREDGSGGDTRHVSSRASPSAEKKCTQSTVVPAVVTRQSTRRTDMVAGKSVHGLEISESPPIKRAKVESSGKGNDSSFCAYPVIPPSVVSRFKSRIKRYKKRVYDLGGIVVQRNFFQQLMSPREWLTNTHIDLLIRSMWNRCGVELLSRQITVTDCYFTRFMSSFYNEFLRSSHGDCKWPNMLCSYVSGVVPDREGLSPWGRDVHYIYAPMNWGCKHWVGLFIDLREWEIQILDPLLSATPKRKVTNYMAPVASMLPHLLKACCGEDAREYLRPGPFKCSRSSGLSENLRTGDCGPLVVKFIELHSHGLPLCGITDDMVDTLRLSYAVHVYSDFVYTII